MVKAAAMEACCMIILPLCRFKSREVNVGVVHNCGLVVPAEVVVGGLQILRNAILSMVWGDNVDVRLCTYEVILLQAGKISHRSVAKSIFHHPCNRPLNRAP